MGSGEAGLGRLCWNRSSERKPEAHLASKFKTVPWEAFPRYSCGDPSVRRARSPRLYKFFPRQSISPRPRRRATLLPACRPPRVSRPPGLPPARGFRFPPGVASGRTTVPAVPPEPRSVLELSPFGSRPSAGPPEPQWDATDAAVLSFFQEGSGRGRSWAAEEPVRDVTVPVQMFLAQKKGSEDGSQGPRGSGRGSTASPPALPRQGTAAGPSPGSSSLALACP